MKHCHLSYEIWIFILNFSHPTNLRDREVRSLRFFGDDLYGFRLWWTRQIGSSAIEMFEVFLANTYHPPWSEIIVVSGNRHVGRESSDSDGCQGDDYQHSLNDYDDNANHGRGDTFQIEGNIEGRRQSHGRNFAEAKQIHNNHVETLTLEGPGPEDENEEKKLNDQQTKDLSHRLTRSAGIETGSDEFVKGPRREEPPLRTAVTSRKPSELLDIILIIVYRDLNLRFEDGTLGGQADIGGVDDTSRNADEEQDEDDSSNGFNTTRTLVRELEHGQEHHHEECNEQSPQSNQGGVSDPVLSEEIQSLVLHEFDDNESFKNPFESNHTGDEDYKKNEEPQESGYQQIQSSYQVEADLLMFFESARKDVSLKLNRMIALINVPSDVSLDRQTSSIDRRDVKTTSDTVLVCSRTGGADLRCIAKVVTNDNEHTGPVHRKSSGEEDMLKNGEDDQDRERMAVAKEAIKAMMVKIPRIDPTALGCEKVAPLVTTAE
ncbi:TRP-domain-containing protein, partial [Aureobasidium melanogenum]